MKHNAMKNRVLVLHYGVFKVRLHQLFNVVRSLRMIATHLHTFIHIYVRYSPDLTLLKVVSSLTTDLFYSRTLNAPQNPSDHYRFEVNEVRKR